MHALRGGGDVNARRLLALWIRGLHLSVSASIDFSALFGVAVLNGPVLLSTVQRLRVAGVDPATAARAR